MSSNIPMAPQGNVPVIGIPDSQDIPRLVFSAPYFEQVPLAELIEPSVIEAVEAALPALVPPYVQGAAETAVSQLAVLLTGSTMSGPLFLSPLMPTQPSQAATMAYVDSMVATAGIPEVPPVPSGQVWARETGQWVPITPQTGVFLPLAGGAMTGNISMSGNTIQNMAAVPAMPNGAAPAQWVLNQIASVSLYQGTWNADTNVPDLTQLSTHVNAYTWIAITTAVGGVVIGAAIPGLQGMTVFNGDTIIYSTVQGQFMAIHAGGLTLPEADERYVQLAGSQMSGALLLNANASQPLQAVTLQQMQTFVPPGVVPEAPNDGQLYGRNGLTASWAPVLPLAGGILTGSLTLAGNATANLNPVPLQQMTSAIGAATAGFLPLAGGTMTGLMTLSGNAATNLNPVPLQQLNAMLGTYLPTAGGTITGSLGIGTTPPAGAQNALVLGGTSGGAVTANDFVTNAYWDGTNWRYLAAGQAWLAGATTSSNAWAWYYGGSGSAGGTLSLATAMSLSDAGVLTTQAGIVSGGSVSTGGAGAFTLVGGAYMGPLNQASFPGGVIWSIGSGGWQMSMQGQVAPGWQVLTGGVPHMSLDGSGNLTITGTLSQGSDATQKTGIELLPAEAGLQTVLALEPKRFAWIDTPDKFQWGFIAQDVQPVIPEAVGSAPDIDGNPLTLTLDVTAIIAALTLAVQQLDQRLGALGG